MRSSFVIVLVCLTVSSAILIYAFTGHFSSSHPPDTTSGHTELVNVEDFSTIVKGGEANFYSTLLMDTNFIDPANHCDFCNRIEYTPGSERKAGIAFRTDTQDLSDFQRIVFFARGERGGELVSFIAVGRNAKDPNRTNNDIFPNQDFTITTKNMTLDSFWKRYEISLGKLKLEEVAYPFGFVITGHKSGVKEIFYLKGVTFDRRAAQHDLPIIKSSGTS